MSYAKVSDDPITFEHSTVMLTKEPSVPIKTLPQLKNSSFSLPMSFIACDECGSSNISGCGCKSENYTCQKCDWKYETHRHTLMDINHNSIVAGAIRL